MINISRKKKKEKTISKAFQLFSFYG